MYKEEKIRFWTILCIIAVVVAVTVTFVDLSIKASILEQANRFRRDLENAVSGQSSNGPTQNRVDNNSGDNSSNADTSMVPFPPRVETPLASNGTEKAGNSRVRGRRTIPKSTEGHPVTPETNDG